MPLIQYGAPWASQPDASISINWANPLAQGLIGAVTGSRNLEHVTNGVLTPFGTNAVRNSSDNGETFGTTSGTTSGWNTGIVPPTLFRATAMQIFTLESWSNFSHIWSCPQNAAWSPGVSTIGVQRRGSNTSLQFHGSDSGASPVVFASNIGLATGQTHRMVFTRRGTTAAAIINGQTEALSASGNFSNSFANPNNLSVALHNRSALSPGDGWVGRTALWLLWARDFTDAELREVYNDPWQLFEPQRIFVPFSAGATFRPAWVRRQSQIIGAGVR